MKKGYQTMGTGIKNRGIKKENKKQKTVPIKNIKTDTFNVYRYFID